MNALPFNPPKATEKLDWLRLIRSENVGPITFRKLMTRFGTAGAALAALPDLARRGGRGRAIRVCSMAVAQEEMENIERIGAHLIALGEPEYPPLLAHVEDAPPLINALGHVGLLAKAAIAMVGARNASLNGKNFARRLAGDLGRAGLLVASGMARGIDASAHEGALDTGTVAVLGGGVDVIYPKENSALYAAIVERGVAISEQEPGCVPQARHFPRRNRLISGMSRGVVVVEASPRSGSLITARMALEQGREVFAVPGSPLDPRSHGTNGLIRQGAALTESADDVLQIINEAYRAPLSEPDSVDFKGVSPVQPDQAELDSARLEVHDCLGPVPVAVDEIIRNCQMSPAVVSVVLLELELAGRLERHPGNKVSLVAEP
jgi:DNA processing protein